jgi:hypothetical protein
MQLISEDLGLKLEKIEPDMLGAAKKVHSSLHLFFAVFPVYLLSLKS